MTFLVKNRSENDVKKHKKTSPAKRGAIAPVRTSELLASKKKIGGGPGPPCLFLVAQGPPQKYYFTYIHLFFIGFL